MNTEMNNQEMIDGYSVNIYKNRHMNDDSYMFYSEYINDDDDYIQLQIDNNDEIQVDIIKIHYSNTNYDLIIIFDDTYTSYIENVNINSPLDIQTTEYFCVDDEEDEEDEDVYDISDVIEMLPNGYDKLSKKLYYYYNDRKVIT